MIKYSVKYYVFVYILVATISNWVIIRQVEAQPDSNTAYLPLITTAYPPVAFLPVIKTRICQLSIEEQQLADLMGSDPGQQRPTFLCNPFLAEVARARAEDMAIRNYFSHVDPDGYGPNYRVRAIGYLLPKYYGQSNDANNIENIAAGFTKATDVWKAFLDSSAARPHLLGENSFFSEQIEYGMGYTYNPDSTYQHYWVIITAKQAVED